MKQRTAILLAAALTAFVLVLAGSLVYAINSKTVTANLAAQEQALPDAPVVGEPVVQIAPTNVPPTTKPLPTQVKLVSAERATQIAFNLLPGSSLQQPPELVNYKGKMAYEVLLNTATVYVDAFNGVVLASNAVVVQNQPAPDSGGGEAAGNNTPQSDPGIGGGVPNTEPPSSYQGDDQHDEGEHHDNDEHEGEDD